MSPSASISVAKLCLKCWSKSHSVIHIANGTMPSKSVGDAPPMGHSCMLSASSVSLSRHGGEGRLPSRRREGIKGNGCRETLLVLTKERKGFMSCRRCAFTFHERQVLQQSIPREGLKNTTCRHRIRKVEHGKQCQTTVATAESQDLTNDS